MPCRGGPLRGIVTPSKRECTRRENATEMVEEEKVEEEEKEKVEVETMLGR